MSVKCNCIDFGVMKCWFQIFTAVSRTTQYEGIKVGLILLVCDIVFLTLEFVCVCPLTIVPLIKHSTLPSHSAHDLLAIISLLLTPKQT